MQELLACGVQKVAIVVPTLPSSRASSSDLNAFRQWQFLTAFHYSSSSLRIDSGKIFSSVDDDEETNIWKPITSDYENLKRRTRFFFEQPFNNDKDVTGDFSRVLQSALRMLGNDDDDGGYMLAIRGECLPLRYLATSSSPSLSSSSVSSCLNDFLQSISLDNPSAMDIKLSVCAATPADANESDMCAEDTYFSPRAKTLEMTLLSSSSSSALSVDRKQSEGQRVNFSGVAAFPCSFLSSAIDEITSGLGESSVWSDPGYDEHKMNYVDDSKYDDAQRGRESFHPLDKLLHSLMSFAPSSSFNTSSRVTGVLCDGAYHHVGDEDGYKQAQEKIVLSKPFILDHVPINELEKAHAKRSRDSFYE